MADRQDITTIASTTFKEMLKSKRRMMKPGNRKRSQGPSFSTVWLYPQAQEFRYRKYVFDLMDIYSDATLPVIKSRIGFWAEEQRVDSVRSDDFESEFEALIASLRAIQFDMFNEKGKGVRDDKGILYSASTITFTLRSISGSVSEFNQNQSFKFTKRILGQPFVSSEPWLTPTLRTWVRNNYELVKSLTDEYIKNVNRIVYDGMNSGLTSQAIEKQVLADIRKMDKNMTRARAKLLTRDQIGKLNGLLTQRRQQDAGVEFYTWRTAGDERVRPSHSKLNGKICRWGDNTVYADTVQDAIAGNWKSRSAAGMYVGIPGQDIQCRCVPIPVYSGLIEQIDKELEREAA